VGEASPIHDGNRTLMPFGEAFIRMAVKSGHHAGVGSLWVSDRGVSAARRVPLGALYGLGLQALGVLAPA